MRTENNKLPYMALLALAMTGFVCIMTETMPAGLLQDISSDMKITLSGAGQWISVYALGSLFTAIPLTIATRSWQRRTVLLMAVAGFLVFNTITAISQSAFFTLVARFGAGAAAGLAWSLLAGYARQLTVPALQGRAMALAMAGTPLALTAGVPLATWAGHLIGWRMAFAAMSVVTILLMSWIVMSVPDMPGQKNSENLTFGKVLATPGVKPVLAVVLTWMLAHNILYTYIAPFMALSGMEDKVDVALLTFGLAAFVGIALTGRLVDRHLRLIVLLSLASFAAVSIILGLLSRSPEIVLAGTAVWGLTFGGAATLLNTALADAAGEGANVAMSLTVVSWNAAIALGGISGGIILNVSGPASLPWSILGLLLSGFAIAFLNKKYAFPLSSRH